MPMIHRSMVASRIGANFGYFGDAGNPCGAGYATSTDSSGNQICTPTANAVSLCPPGYYWDDVSLACANASNPSVQAAPLGAPSIATGSMSTILIGVGILVAGLMIVMPAGGR